LRLLRDVLGNVKLFFLIISAYDDLEGNYGKVTKSVPNPCAAGSIPAGGTNKNNGLAN